MTEATTMLSVAGMSVHYKVRGSSRREGAELCAVNDLSFEIGRGETLGLVGESGCGKSTVGLAVQGLIRITAGRVVFDGTDLGALRGEERRRFRRRMQLVFQDPTSSLNPRMSVGELLTEPMEVHHLYTRDKRALRVASLLDSVGLAERTRWRYPHELSGGQRQRVALARALAVDPELIICDEPVTALDVSVRAQILNLLADLQDGLGVSYLFVSHDLGAVYHLADRVLVMYLGRAMELADRSTLFATPAHPYTRALLDAVPSLDPDETPSGTVIEGDVPSALNPPSGCVFRTRCPVAQDECARVVPQWRDIGTTDQPHLVACHFAPAAVMSRSADSRSADSGAPDSSAAGPSLVHTGPSGQSPGAMAPEPARADGATAGAD